MARDNDIVGCGYDRFDYSASLDGFQEQRPGITGDVIEELAVHRMRFEFGNCDLLHVASYDVTTDSACGRETARSGTTSP